MKSVKDYLKPKTYQQIIDDIKLMSQKQKDDSLGKAMRENSKSIVYALIDNGADVNKTSHYKQDVLMWAVRNDEIDLVKILLDKNADINSQTEHGITPLMIAVNKSNEEIVKILLNAGASIDIKNYKEKNVFDIANFYGDKNMLKLLNKYKSQNRKFLGVEKL